jgi:hypothetical protein
VTTKLRALDGERIELYSDGNSYNGYIGMVGSNITISGLNTVFASGETNVASFDSNGQLWLGATAGAGSKYWHEGNDGTGSGLDADKIDGYHASISSTASTAVIRDANGDTFAGKVNASSFISPGGTFGHATVDADYPIWRPASAITTTGLFYNTGTESLIEFKMNDSVKASVSLTNGTITGNTIKSTVATGTAPLSVASSTLVTNLNADKLDGNDASAFATSGHSHSNLVAGNGITGTTYTGATAYTWSISSHTGTSGSVGTLVVGADTLGVSLGSTGITACAGNDTRLSDARTPTSHDDSKHTHQKFIRITYSGSNVGYRWVHNLNSANVVFTIASNTPEAHYHYKVIDNNNVEIYIDDEPYEDTVLDVTATKAATVETATANIGVI